MKNVAKNPNYEMRFNLIIAGMDKVYEIIQHNRVALEKEGESEKITEAKLIIIENTCLLMDFIVNFNFDRMIYAVFRRLKNEHHIGDFLWSMKFTEKYVDLLDELSTKEFAFVKENMSKIINSEPLPEYPYENNVRQMFPTPEKVKEYKKKAKERKRNAPSLTAPINLKLEL